LRGGRLGGQAAGRGGRDAGRRSRRRAGGWETDGAELLCGDDLLGGLLVTAITHTLIFTLSAHTTGAHTNSVRPD
jgi:hypothetical protein